MYGNKTWTMPKEDDEGYIVDIENNLSVLGLMDGKSLKLYFFIVEVKNAQIQNRISILEAGVYKK